MEKQETSWIKALQLNPDDFQNCPQGENPLLWAFEKDLLSEDRYLEWASTAHQLPCLDTAFFETPWNRELVQDHKSLFDWDQDCFPVHHWNGILYVACLEPQRISSSQNICFVLASPAALMSAWQDCNPGISTIENESNFVAAAPLEPSIEIPAIPEEVPPAVVEPPRIPEADTQEARPNLEPSVLDFSIPPEIQSQTEHLPETLTSTEDLPETPEPLNAEPAAAPVSAEAESETVLDDLPDFAFSAPHSETQDPLWIPEPPVADEQSLHAEDPVLVDAQTETDIPPPPAMDFSDLQIPTNDEAGDNGAPPVPEVLSEEDVPSVSASTEPNPEMAPAPLPDLDFATLQTPEVPATPSSDQKPSLNRETIPAAAPPPLPEEPIIAAPAPPPIPEASEMPPPPMVEPPSPVNTPLMDDDKTPPPEMETEAPPMAIPVPPPQPTVSNIEIPKKHLLTAEVFEKASELKSCTSVTAIVHHVFSKVSTDFEKLMWVGQSKSKPNEWLPQWVFGDWSPSALAWKTPINLKDPNIFRIAWTSKFPFHGEVSLNDTNKTYFSLWDAAKTPEHITVYPLCDTAKSCKGFVVGFGKGADFHQKATLKKMDQIMERAAKQLASEKIKKAS